MTIATEVQRIVAAKEDLRLAINGKGGSLGAEALLDAFGPAVDNLPAGGDAPLAFTAATIANASPVEGDTITLNLTVTAGSSLAYQWLDDAVPIIGATAATLGDAPITPALTCAVTATRTVDGATYTAERSTPPVAVAAVPTTIYRDEVLADSPVLFLTTANAGAWQNSAPGGAAVTTGSAVTFGNTWGGGIDVATLNGTANSVSGVSGPSALGSATDVTFEHWAKTTASTDMYIINPRGASADSGLNAFVGSRHREAGDMRVTLPNATATTSFTATATLNDDEWHHIVCRKLGSEVSIWVDGVKIFTETSNFNVTLSGNSTTGVGAKIHGVQERRFVGELSAPALYNYGLSDARIAAHFAAGGPA